MNTDLTHFSLHHEGRDRFGSYRLSVSGQLVLANLSGVLGESLINQYADELFKIAEQLKIQPWGFVCDAMGLEGAAQLSVETLKEIYCRCSQLQCVRSAYCLQSPLARAQIEALMHNANIERSIDECTFDNVQNAIDAVAQSVQESTA